MLWLVKNIAMVYIIHYLQKEGKFVLHTPGFGQSELIDQIILKNAVFFIAPTCPNRIRTLVKTMTPSEAKFPHAFALSTGRKRTMKKAVDPSLIWEDFEYDVFTHDAFVISKTQEPILAQVKYLMIRGKELKIVR